MIIIIWRKQSRKVDLGALGGEGFFEMMTFDQKPEEGK